MAESAPVESTPTATVEPVVQAAETTATEAPVVAEKARDASGKFAKSETTSTAKPTVPATTDGATPPSTVSGATLPAEGQPTQAQEIKAPQSWKATVREKWSALPTEVRQEVDRREREMTLAMQDAAPAKKFQEQFRQTIAPFEMMLRAEGADPLAATANLFQTAAALRTAPPGTKAQLIANMVKTFGVPIEALAQAIDGQTPTQQGPQQHFDPNQLAQQIKQQIMQEAAQQRQQQTLHQSKSEVEKFAAQAEFLDDVRQEMADYIEINDKRGREISLQAAYDWACKQHPEISQVMQRREAAKQTANVQTSTQRSRAAASSVRSHPASGGNSQSASNDSVRASLEASMASLANR